MKKEKLKELLEKVKKIDNLIFDIQKELRNEIFFDDLEKEVKKVFNENKNKELSVSDVAIKIWIRKGGLELKHKEDYILNPEYNNLEIMIRNIIFYLEEEKKFLKPIRKKKIKEVEEIYHKKV